MKDINVLVSFTLPGDSTVHVKRAARLIVDGRGGLKLFDALTGESEEVKLRGLQSLTIRALPGAASGLVH